MEGNSKCKAPPNNNSKYMDHVYCHTTQTKSVYSNNMTTAGSGSGSAPNTPNNSDVLLNLLKENKQLKGMLILHLDLIQEQSDQLMALRARNNALENTVQDLQKQLQKQRSGEVSTLPPPPLAKIQCKSSTVANVPVLTQTTKPTSKTTSPNSQGISNIIGVGCNGKFINKIVLQRVSSVRGKQRTQSPQSQTTDTEHEDEDDEEQEQYDEVDVEEVIDDEDVAEVRGIHGQDDVENEEEHDEEEEGGGRKVNKTQPENSDAQPHIIDDLYDTGNSTEDSNEVLAVQSKRLRLKQAAKQSLALPRGAKPSVSPASTTTNDGQTTFKAVTSANNSHLTVSRGKQMTIMRWHAPDYHTDESYDSNAETEKRSTSTSCSPSKPSANTNDKKRYNNAHDSRHSHPRPKVRKCSYISTPQLYSTREWEDETPNCDYDHEVSKKESKIVKSEKLEIPKWTEHELTPSYCIEGTEDLSDDIFFKRHSKLEVDEKRRKKWDVQQIREQRRIERLKRRHCKDEIQHTQESTSIQSFYPSTENLQTICYVQDLPVQAFGEMIPRITLGVNGERKDFLLPWLDKVQLQNAIDNNKKPTVTTLSSSSDRTTSLQTQNQMINSSFVLLKKRKRQQSSNFGPSHHTSRQRSLATKLAAVPPPPSSTTSSPSIGTNSATTSGSTPNLRT